MIQSNAGASEEMASTAEELSSQAEQLQSAVAFFKIGDERGHRVKPAAWAGNPQHGAAGPGKQLTRSKAAGAGTKAPLKKVVGLEIDLADKERTDSDFEKY